MNKWVTALCPARIDVSGGWSDTPPITYEHGGAVTMIGLQIRGKVEFMSTLIFSSPEPKAQVSLSDQNLSVVRRRCRKLFTFSSSSPEPLGQFQPNLAQSILG